MTDNWSSLNMESGCNLAPSFNPPTSDSDSDSKHKGAALISGYDRRSSRYHLWMEFYRSPAELSVDSLRVSAGLVAAVVQLVRGTKYQRFPAWLDRWLCRRKQLGLLSFLCALLHAVYSMCLTLRSAARYAMLAAAYRQVSAEQGNTPGAARTRRPPLSALWLAAFR